ncbi:hypothetical protein OG896_24425 [Streptomyces sp. NBC_00669]|uniref:hypothetical protein n=1 Tax=Streptomyces sp. NBC_00669 TaxID=2976011 RepID=UPI002E338C57|nr:hypothetical protein [Streptomyces sp. NBC_00669]
MTGAQLYPGASTAHWYQSAYPGDSMTVNAIVWHSTEGASLSTYSGGAVAPTLTAVPNWTTEKLVWSQHFDFDTSARALVNAPGGVQTNTLNVAQVEVVGTCDPATHASWTKSGGQHLYMPELPDWAIRDLAAFARWAHTEHGVPLTSGLRWASYPGSYGTTNGVRMSGAAWTAFRGHAGHQHVPENDHGDPGSLPMAAILAAATNPLEDTDMTPEQARQLADLHTNLMSINRTNVPVPETHAAGYYLAVAEGHAHSADTKVDGLVEQVGQLTAAVAAIAEHVGIAAT